MRALTEQRHHPFTDFTLDPQTKRVVEVAIFPGADLAGRVVRANVWPGSVP